MEKINLNLKNCYGIGSLNHIFDFSKSNTFLIYSPNGTMKTSLAKTLKYFSEDGAQKPLDQVHPERKALYELKIDDVKIEAKKGAILVVDPDTTNYDTTDKISNFVASKELKEKYDFIYAELDSRKNEFITKLKKTSQSTDCELEIIDAFSEKETDTFFDVIDKISAELYKDNQKYDFRYNDIFDKKGNVKKFLDKYKDDIDLYVESYESIISRSDFFKKSENTFGTYQAKEILKSINDNSFFEAGHSLDLSGKTKISSAEDLKNLVEEEIKKIVNNEDLKKIFEKVDKVIGSNTELRAFKDVIEKNNLLLVELKNYEDFKKNERYPFLQTTILRNY